LREKESKKEAVMREFMFMDWIGTDGSNFFYRTGDPS